MTEVASTAKPTDQASQQNLLHDAIEALAEGFMLFDADDRLVAINRRYRELYGLDDDEFQPGTPWIELLRQNIAKGRYPDTVGREELALAERASLRQKPGQTFDLLLSSGRWLRCSNRPTRDGGMVSLRTDVTEEKLREERLRAMEQEARESEEGLREIVSANPVPMTITRTRDGLVVYANQRAAEMVLTPLDQLIGQRSVDFYASSEDRDAVLKLLREQGRVELLEVQFRRGDGTTFPLALTCRPIIYRGEPAIVSGFHELSEWRRLQDALHQNEKLAALGSLLAGVAHELNNPLSVVLAQAVLMQEKAQDPATLRRADKIQAAAQRCARIVRSFLAIARQRPPEYRSVDIGDVARSALELTGYGLRSSGVEVKVDCPDDLPAVWGDPDQIGQVFMNLIVNAQQALQTIEGRRFLEIEARLDSAKNHVVVRVRDNGPGVPPTIRSRIFDAFFTTKPVGVGTGVGLSVCLGIIQAHGGSLTLNEAGSQGATFMLDLPVAPEAAVPLEASKAASMHSTGWTILIVDDEPEIGQVLVEILEPVAQRIDVATDGLAALRLAEERSYDLVVSDLRMPDLDGPGLHRRFAQRGDGMHERMVFVTGDTLHHELESFLTTTRAPIIEKPLEPAEVRRRVMEFMTAAEEGARRDRLHR